MVGGSERESPPLIRKENTRTPGRHGLPDFLFSSLPCFPTPIPATRFGLTSHHRTRSPIGWEAVAYCSFICSSRYGSLPPSFRLYFPIVCRVYVARGRTSPSHHFPSSLTRIVALTVFFRTSYTSLLRVYFILFALAVTSSVSRPTHRSRPSLVPMIPTEDPIWSPFQL